MKRGALAAIVLLGVAGCPSGGTLEKDIQTMCDAPLAVPAQAGDDPATRATRIVEHIEANLTTDEGRELWKGILALPNAESKKKALSIRATRLKIDCPLVESAL